MGGFPSFAISILSFYSSFSEKAPSLSVFPSVETEGVSLPLPFPRALLPREEDTQFRSRNFPRDVRDPSPDPFISVIDVTLGVLSAVSLMGDWNGELISESDVPRLRYCTGELCTGEFCNGSLCTGSLCSIYPSFTLFLIFLLSLQCAPHAPHSPPHHV